MQDDQNDRCSFQHKVFQFGGKKNKFYSFSNQLIRRVAKIQHLESTE